MQAHHLHSVGHVSDLHRFPDSPGLGIKLKTRLHFCPLPNPGTW